MKRCPGCASLADATDKVCTLCGASLDGVPAEDVDVGPDRSEIPASGSRLAKIYAAVFAVVGILGGIALGYLFKVESYYHEEFNYTLMFITWVGTFVSLVPFHLVYYHFLNQEKIVDLLSAENSKGK